MRTQMFSCWAAGIPAFVWWCAFDQGRYLFAVPPADLFDPRYAGVGGHGDILAEGPIAR